MLVSLLLALAAPAPAKSAPAICLDALQTPEGVRYLNSGPDYAQEIWNGTYPQAHEEGDKLRAALQARWRSMGPHLDLKALDETCSAVLTAWFSGARHELGRTHVITPKR